MVPAGCGAGPGAGFAVVAGRFGAAGAGALAAGLVVEPVPSGAGVVVGSAEVDVVGSPLVDVVGKGGASRPAATVVGPSWVAAATPPAASRRTTHMARARAVRRLYALRPTLLTSGMIGTYGNGLYLPARTAWVWVTRATLLPVSSKRSVSITITVRPVCRGRATPSTWPPDTARRKLVLDSMVVVPAAPSGRLRKAQMPPMVSARLMRAPPCNTPPVVQRVGSQASLARTSSAPAETSSTPM